VETVGRKRVEAAGERWRRAVGVSEGGLWRVLEHGTGGLLEVGGGRWSGGGGEEEETQSQWPGDACKERKGRAITLLLAPDAPAAHQD